MRAPGRMMLLLAWLSVAAVSCQGHQLMPGLGLVTPGGKAAAEVDIESLRGIAKLKTIDEYVDQMRLGSPRMAEGMTENPEAREATPASCMPEMRSVCLDLPKNDSSVYFPACVRLPQCGGCCVMGQQCLPVQTLDHTFWITKTPLRSFAKKRSQSAPTMRWRGRSLVRGSRMGRARRGRKTRGTLMHYVTAQEHVACDCQCRAQPSDCTVTQYYDPRKCMCMCRDREAQQRCGAQEGTHYWDGAACACRCVRRVQCSSTQRYDEAQCSCRSSTSP